MLEDFEEMIKVFDYVRVLAVNEGEDSFELLSKKRFSINQKRVRGQAKKTNRLFRLGEISLQRQGLQEHW